MQMLGVKKSKLKQEKEREEALNIYLLQAEGDLIGMAKENARSKEDAKKFGKSRVKQRKELAFLKSRIILLANIE